MDEIATFGLHKKLHSISRWAHRLGLDKIWIALLDATKTDRHPDYVGTIVQFLMQQDSSALLRIWSDELPCAEELRRLSDACQASPFIATEYPAMPSIKQVSRQLTGGLLTKLPAVALVARPVTATTDEDRQWIVGLRMWVLLQCINSVFQGGRPNSYLVEITQKLRLAIDKDEKWLGLFARLRGSTASANGMTRDLTSACERLLANQNVPVESAAHRNLLSTLRNFCNGKTPVSGEDDGTEDQGLFRRFLDQKSQQIPTSFVASEVQGGWRLLDNASPGQDQDEQVLTQNFDPPGAEESILKLAIVDEDRTPLEQDHQAKGILLATAEDHQFLPFSWNRPSPAEKYCLEQWITSALKSSDLMLQSLASFVEIAAKSAYSLDTVRTIQLSDVPAQDWSIDIDRRHLHRLPPRRYNGWRVTAEAASWVEPIATTSRIMLNPAVATTLQRLRADASASRQLGHLWPISVGDTPETLFNRICRETKGLERLRSGMLAHILEQRVFEGTGDPVLSQLLASHPRTGLGGACAYASYRSDQVRRLLTNATSESTNFPNDPIEPLSNAAGSELSPLDAALRQACQEALSKVNDLATQSEQWVAHHNALTAYMVTVLLAATGARPVSSPFESLKYFDWITHAIYIEDKVSSQLHQGRLVPLPESVVSLMQNSYLPHLARLAVTVAQIDGPLSEVLTKLSRGVPCERLPLFFLLGRSSENEKQLRWIEVSETSLSALEVFSWPLPWNLMRHRLPSTLKRAGQDHECINGLTGHGENGTAAYGPYSMRIWHADAQKMRQPLMDALLNLQLQTPKMPQWPASTIPAQTGQAPTSCLGTVSNFGAMARTIRRKDSHKKAAQQARADILDFVGGRTIDSLSPQEWETLSQKMLLNVDGRPRTLGTLRYEALQHWIAQNWQDSGLRPRIKRRYIPSLEEQSPFTVDAIGCLERISASLENARRIQAILSRPSKRESRALGILFVILESRLGDPAVIKELLQGKNFRLVLFQKRYYIEHSPGLDKAPDAPVRRHAVSAAAAVLLARGKSSTYRLDLRQWPVADLLRVIGQPFGLDDRQFESLQSCTLAIAIHVRQANALQYPGLVAAYLNGDIISAGLHHLDWVRVSLGKAVSPAALARPGSDASKSDTEDEDENDALPSEAMDEGYVAWPDAFMSLDHEKPATRPEMSQLQHCSFKFFQHIRDALNAELDGTNPSRRNLDAKLRTLISANKDLVSRSCLLLGEWQRSLLWRKTKKGLIRIRSLQRYLNALSVCFQAMAYEHDLLECDGDEVTEFYRKVMEVRQLVRPGHSPETGVLSPQATAAEKIDGDDAETAMQYRSQGLALQLLTDFHRLVSREFGVEDPDWSELSISDALLSISPGMMTEAEYCCALRTLTPAPAQASREDLARAFILLTIYRFGLRGDESTGLLRSDWVDDQPDAIVLLVRTNRFRRLKTAAAQRQVPLLFVLTDQEKEILASWLTSWEGITTLSSAGPLFADRQLPDKLMNVKQLRRDVGKIIKQVTGNPDLSPHHARHSFGNRVALLLMQSAGSIWPHAATTSQSNEERQNHVRRLLLGTDQVTRRSLWAIARLLGHAHPTTTVRSYLHFLPDLAMHYVNLPVSDKRPVSKHLSAICVNLENLAFTEDYLQPIPTEFEVAAPSPLTTDRALSFLHLCQRGVQTVRAQQIVGISTEDADQLIHGVEKIDSILARRPAINRSMGGPYNLLGHIPQARWADLIARAHDVAWKPESPEKLAITSDELPLMIGSSRQIVLWKPLHFRFFREMVDLWKLGEDSYRIHSTVTGQAALQGMADQFQLRLEPTTGTQANKSFQQIDTITVEIGDSSMLVRHRCAALAQTHARSAFRSNHELVLLVLVSLALQ
ncbi:MAG: hypothetical protein A3J24_07970 [Deltaproteobacteria bacterium RIFCSPLOWO2_02_FULL_53_8]|nr:MAG: hypothetical protein A3J24_07970 [Deltaproteobacteria bacterium RIFCSPLOWO2_02_FULL_53_8]